MRSYTSVFGEMAEKLDEFDAYGAEERDELLEMVEMAEESAMVELEQFGCIEFEPQFNWNATATPEDYGWSRAVFDIIKFEGADAEPLFELF